MAITDLDRAIDREHEHLAKSLETSDAVAFIAHLGAIQALRKEKQIQEAAVRLADGSRWEVVAG